MNAGLSARAPWRRKRLRVFTAASETFTQRNINATVQESLEGFKSVVAGAKRDGMAVRGYVSTAWFCPYEGRIEPAYGLDVMKRLLDLGVDEISLGDTVGKASPVDVRMLLDLVLPQIAAKSDLAAFSRYLWHGHGQCVDGLG